MGDQVPQPLQPTTQPRRTVSIQGATPNGEYSGSHKGGVPRAQGVSHRSVSAERVSADRKRVLQGRHSRGPALSSGVGWQHAAPFAAGRAEGLGAPLGGSDNRQARMRAGLVFQYT